MEELLHVLERAARGEESAYREIYRSFRPLVARLARAFSALDADEVEDVVQESFARAFRGLPALRDRRAFEPWLLSIARNRAISSLSRKGAAARVSAELAKEDPARAEIVPDAMRAEGEAEIVRKLIEELPEGTEKTTVRLFYVEGKLSAREIAEQMGVGKSAVTMRLERFRARVKQELIRRLLATWWEQR